MSVSEEALTKTAALYTKWPRTPMDCLLWRISKDKLAAHLSEGLCVGNRFVADMSDDEKAEIQAEMLMRPELAGIPMVIDLLAPDGTLDLMYERPRLKETL